MLKHLLVALQKGYMLSNPEVWKNAGVATALLSALISAVVGIAVHQEWLPHGIDAEIIMQVSSALVALVGTFLGYVQVATTEKIGVKPRATATSVSDTTAVQNHAAVDAVEHRTRGKSAADVGRETWLGTR